MKYIAILDTDEFKDFKFFEDADGKYLAVKDAGAKSDEWLPLHFETLASCEDSVKHSTELTKKSPADVCKERADAIYCLKANSDYHSELCEECEHYGVCDHTFCDDINENILKMLNTESNYIAYLQKRAKEYPDSLFGDGIRHCLNVISDFQRGDVSDYVDLK